MSIPPPDPNKSSLLVNQESPATVPSSRAIPPVGRIVFGVIAAIAGLTLLADGVLHLFPTAGAVRISYFVLVPILFLTAFLFFATAIRDLRK